MRNQSKYVCAISDIYSMIDIYVHSLPSSEPSRVVASYWQSIIVLCIQYWLRLIR